MGSVVSSKRIASNTILLYVRMIITMIISLYTSRVVLNVLGVTDYGLYNIVGGVVALFSFLNNAMSAATQRFITYELGRGNQQTLSRVFSMSVTSHIIIIIIFAILAETVGLWFLNSQIQIPEGRADIANWVYQFSIVVLCFNILSVPYSASIIAHEKMNYYAIISILDAVMKLGIALIIAHISIDKLATYSFLLALESFLVFLSYKILCSRKFTMCKYVYFFDRKLFKQLFSFSGWSMLGQLSLVSANQGSNILINIFYSVTVNATMGIANQVNGAVNNLVSSFQTAFQPQITKSYAIGDFYGLNSLIQKASKLSFYLLYVVSLPLILNIKDVLSLWLGNVPLYSEVFCTLILIASMINAVAGPLWMAIFATGNIKIYQIVISLIYILDIPIVYLLFSIGCPPLFAIVVKILINVVILIVRIIFTTKKIQGFSAGKFMSKVIAPICFVVLITTSLSMFLHNFTHDIGIWGKLLIIILEVVLSSITIYFVGLSHSEKQFINRIVVSFYNKIKHV